MGFEHLVTSFGTKLPKQEWQIDLWHQAPEKSNVLRMLNLAFFKTAIKCWTLTNASYLPQDSPGACLFEAHPHSSSFTFV